MGAECAAGVGGEMTSPVYHPLLPAGRRSECFLPAEMLTDPCFNLEAAMLKGN